MIPEALGSGLHVLSQEVGAGSLASPFLGPGAELSSPLLPLHPLRQAVAPFTASVLMH